MQVIQSSSLPEARLKILSVSRKSEEKEEEERKMQVLSSSSSSSSPNLNLSLFLPSQKTPNFLFKIPTKSISSSSSIPLCSSSRDSPLPSLHQTLDEDTNNNVIETSEGIDLENDGLLLVRRPVMEVTDDDDGEERVPSSVFDAGLNEFAKKMPIFEPERVEPTNVEKRLIVNLELALYRAKILSRSFNYEEAEKLLQKCIYSWPDDGRPYVALGRILGKQSKTEEARALYEKGCQATQGENSYIWQCWAVLENKVGNLKRARELFDAATVADKRHVAAWHGWAVLELKQGNIKKARNLLAKGLKFCGGNEYIYQTLALLEAKSNRFEQARSLFRQATKCNPKSCASWLAWAQLEVQQENNAASRQLFEKAVQASPKNRFAWHVWGIFEANLGNIEKGRKLLKIGHALNPRDPVLLQSLALLEYRYSTANLARVLFKRASNIDPRHQPVWMAWGWMEWKEGNIDTARELYQRALMINSTSESAARCLQAWGVLEQRMGNLSAARRLFRSSLNINSQSYITWMTWASLEEDQGNNVRAEEIRDLYFQQRTEVVDDPSWVMGLMDMIDPAIDSIKRVFNLDDPSAYYKLPESNKANENGITGGESQGGGPWMDDKESKFDLDCFIRRKLLLDPLNLDVLLETSQTAKVRTGRDVYISKRRTSTA